MPVHVCDMLQWGLGVPWHICGSLMMPLGIWFSLSKSGSQDFNSDYQAW